MYWLTLSRLYKKIQYETDKQTQAGSYYANFIGIIYIPILIIGTDVLTYRLFQVLKPF
jgi:hypothetical protein